MTTPVQMPRYIGWSRREFRHGERYRAVVTNATVAITRNELEQYARKEGCAAELAITERTAADGPDPDHCEALGGIMRYAAGVIHHKPTRQTAAAGGAR